jgi:hypothetical protein
LRLLDLPGPSRVQFYQGLQLPKAPVFHPYHPVENMRDGRVIRVTLNLKLPASFLPALPENIRSYLAAESIAAPDLFVVSQDLPWAAGTVLCFRPGGWTDPDAPLLPPYERLHNCRVRLFGAEPGIHIVGRQEADGSVRGQVHMHPQEGAIVASPDNFHLAGVDLQRSTSFWSVIRCEDGRAAVTLHLLLDDPDAERLETSARDAHDLDALLTALDQGPMAAGTVLPALQFLFQPLISHVPGVAPQ